MKWSDAITFRSQIGRRVLWGAFSLTTFFVFFVVFFGDRDYRKDLSITKGNSYIEGLRIVNRKDASELWVITARKADLSRDETTAQMESVAIDIKKEGAVLNAESGFYNMNTRDLRLENNVILRVRGSVISANTLLWNSASGTLSSDDRVEMQGDKFKIEGEGLATTEDNKVRLMRNVKATFF